MSSSPIARTLALLVTFSLAACAAQNDDPLGQGGGSSSTGGAGGATGGTSNSGGSTSSTGGVSATGGTSSGGAATGGSNAGGSTSTGGAVGTGGSSGSVDLPYVENWDDGNTSQWIASDATLASNFSLVDSDKGKSLQFDSGNGEVLYAGGNRNWTDVHLSLSFKIVSGTPTVAIAVRLAAVKNYYYLELGNSHFKIRDRSNGGSDITPSGSAPPLTVGQWYTIDLTVQGTTLTGSLDGTVIATGTMNSSTPLPAGGIGLGARSGSTGVVLFDDISVTAP